MCVGVQTGLNWLMIRYNCGIIMYQINKKISKFRRTEAFFRSNYSTNPILVKYEGHKELSVIVDVCWDVNLIDTARRFRSAYYLHHHAHK